MKLSEKRIEFTQDLALLIQYAAARGMYLAADWVKRNKVANDSVKGAKNSNHLQALAADMNLYIDGKYQTATDAHRELGMFWESIRPENRWGGRYKDGNHYERYK